MKAAGETRPAPCGCAPGSRARVQLECVVSQARDTAELGRAAPGPEWGWAAAVGDWQVN